MEKNTDDVKEPVIFEYYDYRSFLRDLVLYERARCHVFSNRYIVQKAGFKSPTALKHVIDGKRNLTLESANRFASALKIEGLRRHYFLTLVLFNQTTSLGERERYLNELVELKRTENPSLLDKDRYDVLAKWYHLAIREIVCLPDYKNSMKWIARVLCPQITTNEASESLELLKKLGLIEKTEGQYAAAEKTLSTDDCVRSVKALEFHRQMIQLGSEALTRFPGSEREISGTTIRIAKQDVANIKILLRDFRKKMLTLAANSPDADQVYQLNFQFFPLVTPVRKARLDEEIEE